MKTVLVTGAAGFVGRNVVEALSRKQGTRVIGFDLGQDQRELQAGLQVADVVFHLAGVNRPESLEDFKTGNTRFTEQILAKLRDIGRQPVIAFSSSVQATMNNPYGISKRRAEDAIRRHSEATGTRAVIPAQERLRKVVPAQLQFRDRDLLPQHSTRPADHDLRSESRTGTGLY